MKIRAICEKCGKEAEIDKEKSTSNWTVYKTICKCGGRIIPKI
ncbi:MAG: hypothetical protein ACLR02_11345 [Clostridium sp.]